MAKGRPIAKRGNAASSTSRGRASLSANMEDYIEAIYQLIMQEYIDLNTALDAAPNPDELKMRLKGIRSGSTGGILG